MREYFSDLPGRKPHIGVYGLKKVIAHIVVRPLERLVNRMALRVVLLALWGMYLGWARPQPAAAQSASNQQTSVLVLRGGLLIDGTGRAPLENSVVLIEGAKIQRVGREGETPIPAGATVINAAGKTIIPGLVDSHIHLRDFFQPLCLYWGVTTVADLANVPSWILAEKEAVEKGAVLGPSILTVGGGLDRPPRERSWVETFANGNPSRGYLRDESSLEAAILEAKQSGVDAIKLFGIETPLMKRAVEIAHREGLTVFAHYSSATVGRGTDEILDTGLDMHVHTFGLEKATVSKAVRDQIIRGEIAHPEYLMNSAAFPDLAQKMVDRKMFLNPTLGAHWAQFSRYREEFDRINTAVLGEPVGSLLSDAVRRRFSETYKPYTGEHPEQIEQGYQKIGEFVKTFVDKGGKVVAGSDAVFKTPGISLHFEMQMLREIGLTPMQVLQAATLWSMEAFHKEGGAGSVERGKRADIVVLNRNPLEDMAATRDIHIVIKNGKIVDREALAQWKDTLPRPVPVDTGGTPNSLIRIPLIEGTSPGSLPANVDRVPEVIIRGRNFTPECRVLFNDRFVATKFYDSGRLGITIEPSLLKEPGTYLVTVVQPGSGGGVSNLWYFIVTY